MAVEFASSAISVPGNEFAGSETSGLVLLFVMRLETGRPHPSVVNSLLINAAANVWRR